MGRGGNKRIGRWGGRRDGRKRRKRRKKRRRRMRRRGIAVDGEDEGK